MIDLKLLVVMLFEIALYGNIYLLLGSSTSYLITKYFSKEYDKKKSKLRNFLQLFLEVGLVMIATHYIQIFVGKIPNPFQGYHGFNLKNLSEMKGGIILAFSFLLYLKTNIQSKVDNLYLSIL